MSVTTYNVDAGKDRAVIELSGETKVVFSFDPNIIAVEAVSGEVNVSLDEGAAAGDDGCDTLSEGQSTRMNPIADKCIYVNGTGTVRVWGGRSGDDCPFKKGGKGGDPGGSSETVLYTRTNQGATDDVTLSEAWTNFDAVVFVYTMDSEDSSRVTAYYPTSVLDGTMTANTNAGAYCVYGADSTTPTIITAWSGNPGDLILKKVIGINYGG